MNSRSRSRRLFSLLLAIGLLGAGGLWWTARNADPSRLLELALRQHSEKLPFEVESIEIQKTWRELLHGHLNALNAVLRWGRFRIRLSGPVQIEGDPKDTDLLAHYDPEVTIEPIDAPKEGDRSAPIALHLTLESSRDLKTIRSIGLKSSARAWAWKLFGVEIAGLEADLRWIPGNLRQTLGIRLLKYAHPPAMSMELERLALDGETSIWLGTRVDLKAQRGRLFWKNREIRLPLDRFPVRLAADFDPAAPSAKAHLLIGALTLDGELLGRGGRPEEALLSWKIPRFEVPAALSELASLEPEPREAWVQEVRKLKIRSGTLAAEGRMSTRLPYVPGKSALPDSATHLTFQGLSAWPTEWPIAIGGLNLALDLGSRNGKVELNGKVDAQKVDFMHLRSRLEPTPIELHSKADPSGKWSDWAIRIGEGRIPLRTPLPFAIGALEGEVRVSPKPEAKLKTSAELQPVELAQLVSPFCIRGSGKIPLPSALVEAHFPRIEAGEDSIEPDGKVSVSVFDGKLELSDVGIYHFGTEVPELDFTAEAKGIQLAKIGDWLSLGEMRGTLEGFARDVTVQGWLPTQFDSRFEVRPLPGRSRVVFSPEAAQNFIEVVTGSNLPEIPGIVKWYAFGTPRYLFGGYDIDYAGMALQASDGFIRVETLDPPEVYKKERKHFILYGQSIFARVPVLGGFAQGGLRVPIESSHYPVIMDAAAISNYLRQLKDRLESLKARKAKKKEKSPNEKASDNAPDGVNDDEIDCSPPDPLAPPEAG